MPSGEGGRHSRQAPERVQARGEGCGFATALRSRAFLRQIAVVLVENLQANCDLRLVDAAKIVAEVQTRLV